MGKLKKFVKDGLRKKNLEYEEDPKSSGESRKKDKHVKKVEPNLAAKVEDEGGLLKVFDDSLSGVEKAIKKKSKKRKFHQIAEQSPCAGDKSSISEHKHCKKSKKEKIIEAKKGVEERDGKEMKGKEEKKEKGGRKEKKCDIGDVEVQSDVSFECSKGKEKMATPQSASVKGIYHMETSTSKDAVRSTPSDTHACADSARDSESGLETNSAQISDKRLKKKKERIRKREEKKEKVREAKEMKERDKEKKKKVKKEKMEKKKRKNHAQLQESIAVTHESESSSIPEHSGPQKPDLNDDSESSVEQQLKTEDVALPKTEVVDIDSDSTQEMDKKDNLGTGRATNVAEKPVKPDDADAGLSIAEHQPLFNRGSFRKPQETNQGRRRSSASQPGTPFKRVQEDDITFDNKRLMDNSFHSKNDTYGIRAHQDLVVTKGKGFRKEKTKKKRLNHHGGKINYEVNSYQFSDSD